MSGTNTEAFRVDSPRAIGKAVDRLEEYNERTVRRVEITLTTYPEGQNE